MWPNGALGEVGELPSRLISSLNFYTQRMSEPYRDVSDFITTVLRRVTNFLVLHDAHTSRR